MQYLVRSNHKGEEHDSNKKREKEIYMEIFVILRLIDDEAIH